VIDPDNPIVKLCAEGIAAEAQHRHAEASARYRQAWDLHSDDYEACIAAHYLARQQETLAESLAWNQTALDYARRVPLERVADFLPSLYLNLGWSYEVLDNLSEARRCYEEGAACLGELPPGPYTDIVRDGIRRGLERTQ
jgi:tetratricopeptide (TPR) repeat protein